MSNPGSCAQPLYLEYLLELHMNSLPTDSIQLLVDTLRDEFIGTRLALKKAFPLNDPEKTVIFAKAFGLQNLMRAFEASNVRHLPSPFSLEATLALIPSAFNSPDLIMLLCKLIHYNLLNTEMLALRNDQEETLLMKMSDNVGVLNFLVHNSEVNAIDTRGETAMIKAVKKRNMKTASILIAHGGNAYLKDFSEKHALNYSTEAGLFLH